MKLSILFPQSPTGMVSRLCPDDQCVPRLFQLAAFKGEPEVAEAHLSLICRLPGEAGTTCPYCGEDAADDDFNHPDDIEAITKQLGWMFEQDVVDWLDDTLRGMARRINSSAGRKRGMISVKMDYKRSPRSRVPPRFYREDLLRDLTCDICGWRYGVYAIALFCPGCGARNLHVHFQREVQLITEQVDLAQQMKEEKRELAYRLLGNAHEDVLTALETYLKVVYRFLVKHRRPTEVDDLLGRKLMLQNIQKVRRRFEEIDIDPYSNLMDDDLDFLRLNIEKRHVVGHNLSIADDFFTEHDESEQVGQTVRFLGDDIIRFADLARQVVEDLESSCPEFQACK